MNWLQKTSWDKHEKDKKHIYLWHASPDRHNILSSRSRMGKGDYSYRGLYFTESYNSLIRDWVPYILGKKNATDSYKELFIHKVSVPEWVLKESYKRQKQVFDIEDRQNAASFGFWAWGSQVFISEDLLEELSLISVDKMNRSDLMKQERNQIRFKSDTVRSYSHKPQD